METGINPNASEALKKAFSVSCSEVIAWSKTASDAELKDALASIYRTPPNEPYLGCIREEIEDRKHREIEAHLKALKRPHWTVLPNFWLTVISAAAALIAAYFAWLALGK
jgi:hypothetical protein